MPKHKTPIPDKPKFSPLAWGTLFFTLWFTLRTVPKLTVFQSIFSYLLIVFSAVLWLSIIIPWLRVQLNRDSVTTIFAPLLFTMSFIAYTLGWVTNLLKLKGIDFDVSVYFGFLWLILYLLIIIRISNKTIGIIAGLFFVGAGIFYLVKSNEIGGITLLLVGCIVAWIAASRPKWVWHESIDL